MAGGAPLVVPWEEDDDAEAARLHRELNARPARRGRARPRGEAAEEEEQGAAVKEEEADAEEVKVRAVEWWPVKAEPDEEVKVLDVEWVGEGGKRRRVKPEREEEGGTAEAGPSGREAGGQQAGNSGRGASMFRGVIKVKGAKAKPWTAYVTEDGKGRQIYIGTFAREEDAARAFDRVNIPKLGHAEANTNFPVEEYRAEWAQLEALGAEAAAAREMQRAKRLEA